MLGMSDLLLKELGRYDHLAFDHLVCSVLSLQRWQGRII
jgi:hypothetical protein